LRGIWKNTGRGRTSERASEGAEWAVWMSVALARSLVGALAYRSWLVILPPASIVSQRSPEKESLLFFPALAEEKSKIRGSEVQKSGRWASVSLPLRRVGARANLCSSPSPSSTPPPPASPRPHSICSHTTFGPPRGRHPQCHGISKPHPSLGRHEGGGGGDDDDNPRRRLPEIPASQRSNSERRRRKRKSQTDISALRDSICSWTPRHLRGQLFSLVISPVSSSTWRQFHHERNASRGKNALDPP